MSFNMLMMDDAGYEKDKRELLYKIRTVLYVGSETSD